MSCLVGWFWICKLEKAVLVEDREREEGGRGWVVV